MKVLSPLFKALLFFVIPTFSFSMKVFVVQFSNNGLETLKIKMPASTHHSQGGLPVSTAEEFLKTHCPADIVIEHFEFYNSVTERFEVLLPSDYLEESVRLHTVLIKTQDSADEQLCIEGRAFDISEGLYIGSRPLRIEEQVNRSEGTGLNTWDGSVVLAKYLEKHSYLVHNKKVLEVGSGTGVSGLAAAYLGASLSVLTDLDYTLDNLRANVELNYPGEEEVVLNKPHVRALDWTDALTYLVPSDFAPLPIASIDHEGLGESVEGNVGSVSGGVAVGNAWDVVLGADVVWLEALVEPLATALRAHCSPSTLILLSHQKRSEHTDSALFSYLREFFVVMKVEAQELNSDFSSPKINIFECRLKE